MNESKSNSAKPMLKAWPAWERYINGAPRSEWAKAVFAFNSRWQLANTLQSMIISGYADGSNVPLAYHALIKVEIVCTAAEQLARVIYYPTPPKECYLVVVDPFAAQQVRNQLNLEIDSRFVQNLLDEAAATAKTNIKRFCAGESNDLMHLMRPLRNAVSHGTATPSGLGIGRGQQRERNRIDVIFELCDHVLESCDFQFAEMVNHL